MRPVRIFLLLVFLLAVLAGRVAAAEPTHLTITAPAEVSAGEDILVKARLTDAAGRPITGMRLGLYQVGSVGQSQIAEATTDAAGTASFLQTESVVAHLSLAVTFAGDTRRAASRAATQVEITGIDVPPSVLMAHSPDPLIKLVLFLILGAVWSTYAFAVSCILRMLRERRKTEDVRPIGWGRL